MANPIPEGYNSIISVLFQWGRSGLIPNATVVKSYHAPAMDNVTGTMNLLPATVYKSTFRGSQITSLLAELIEGKVITPEEKKAPLYRSIGTGHGITGVLVDIAKTVSQGSNGSGSVTSQIRTLSEATLPDISAALKKIEAKTNEPSKMTPIEVQELAKQVTITGQGIGGFLSSLSNYNYAGSNVEDFNRNDIPYGLDTTVAMDNVRNGAKIKEAALTAKGQEQYQETVKNLVAGTLGDRMITSFAIEMPKIVDDLEDAKAFFSTPPLWEKLVAKESDERVENDTRREIPQRYELIATGVPCAIPGVLNCHLALYDNVDVAPVNYEYTIPETVTYYNPDPTDLASSEYEIEDPITLLNNRK